MPEIPQDPNTTVAGTRAEAVASGRPASDPPDDVAIEGRRRSFNAITKKWTQTDICPVCGDTEWVIGDVSDLPIRLPGSDIGTVSRATHVVPLVPVTCITCGFTRLFHELYLFNEEELHLSPEDIVERSE